MAMTLRAKKLLSFDCPSCGASIIAEGLPPFVPVACPKCHEKTRVPVRLGRFLLLRAVESSPGGRLFHAHDADLGRAVRILVLRDAQAPEGLRELHLAKFLSRVPCQGIPRVLSHEEIDKQPCLVFEYTGLPSLERLVGKHGPMSPARALTVATGAARILRHAAAAGLAHMQLVPANLLIGPEDETWVRGFSPLNFSDAPPPEGWVGTSLRWHAPEARAGSLKPGALQDMWSLGALLGFTLTGQRPADADHDALVNRLTSVNLPAPAIACVLRLCAPWPEGRFSSWDEATACLKTAMDDLTRPAGQAMPQVVEPTTAQSSEESSLPGTSRAMDDSAIVAFETLARHNMGDSSSGRIPTIPADAEDDFAMDFGALLDREPSELPDLTDSQTTDSQATDASSTDDTDFFDSSASPEAELKTLAKAEPELSPSAVEEETTDAPEAFNAPSMEAPLAQAPATPAPELSFDETDAEEPAFEEPAFEDPTFEEPEFEEPSFDEEPAFELDASAALTEPVAETIEPPPTPAPVVTPIVSHVPAEPSFAAASFEEEPPADADAAKHLGLHTGLSGDQMSRLKGFKKKPATEQEAPAPVAAPVAAAPKAEPAVERPAVVAQAQAPAPVAVPAAAETPVSLPTELPPAPLSLGEEPPADADATKHLGLHTGLSGDQMSRLKGFKKKPATEQEAAAPAAAPVAAAPKAEPVVERPAVAAQAQAPAPVAAQVAAEAPMSLPAELPPAPLSLGEEPPADADAAKHLGLHTGLSGDQMSRLKGFKKKPATEQAAGESNSALPLTKATESSRPVTIAPEAQAAGSGQKNRMQMALAKLKGGAGAPSFGATPARPLPTPPAADGAPMPAAAPEPEAPATLPEVALPMETPPESGEIKKLGLHQGLSGDQMAKLAKLRKKPQA